MGWMLAGYIVLVGVLSSVHAIYIKCPDRTVFNETLNRCHLPDSELYKCPELLTNSSPNDSPYAYDCQQYRGTRAHTQHHHLNEHQATAKYRLHLQHNNLQYNVAANMGQLIVEFNNENTTMNLLNFGTAEANVACREAGFRLGADTAEPLIIDPTKQSPSRMFYMNELRCSGNESTLAQCSHTSWNQADGERTIYLKCKEPENICLYNEWSCPNEDKCLSLHLVCDGASDCQDESDESAAVCNQTVQFRLVNSAVPAGEQVRSGRVEMLYKGLWGTVSSNEVSAHEAKVVCRSLGIADKGEVLATSDPVKSHVWMYDVNCYNIKPVPLNLLGCNHSIQPNSIPCEDTECDYDYTLSVNCVGTYTAPVIHEIPPVTRHHNHHHDSASACGRIQVSSNEILPPSFARYGHHPWVAKIYVHDISSKKIVSKCGGSVLDRRHILTAAHCIHNFDHIYYVVRVGKHKYKTTLETGKDLVPERKFNHSNYSKKTLQNDIGVLRLTKDIIEFGDYVQPVCLPPSNAVHNSGLKCMIAGWGYVNSKNNATAEDLRATSVTIIDDADCESVYKQDFMPNTFCAGYLRDDVADACENDSGGPLVCVDNAGVHTQYGIVSWGGKKCGQQGNPGVYVKVADYLDWINEHLSD